MEMLHLQPSLRRICGGERKKQIPSPATFSRAFAEFAEAGLGDNVHAALVQKHVGDQIVMHISRDATEIDAREKAAPKSKVEPKPKKKRGRPKKGEVPEAPEPTRLQKQFTQRIDEALADLPSVCDKGAKTDARGHGHFWIGWKAPIDWTEGGLPVHVVTTSASLHDSQAAIAMARRSAQRITSLYD